MYSKPDAIRFQRQLGAQEKHALLSNAIARIAGHQDSTVNGKALKLSLHAFTVLLLETRAIESPGEYFLTEAGLISTAAVSGARSQRRRKTFAPVFAKLRDRSGNNPLPVSDVAKEVPLRDGARGSRHHHSIN